MRQRLVGQRVPRVNDHKALLGTGHYLDDLEVPRVLHAAIVRSPVAHGEVLRIDGSRVGTGATVLGLVELGAHLRAELPVLWHMPVQRQVSTPAFDAQVRYVGQPVAVVVAGSRYVAEDGVDSVDIDIEERPAVVTMEQALAPTAVLLYPELGTNVLAELEGGDTVADTDAVFAAAQRTLRTRLRIGRLTGMPIEPRGILVVPERGGKLTIHTSTQAAHAVREVVCQVLGLANHRVRVITPDVGGGFGLKDHLYEDELMVIVAALELGRPVKWVEDRQEALTVTTQARDEVHDIEAAFDDDGRLRGLRVDSLRNGGGRCAIFGGGPLFTALGLAPGPYRWDAVRVTGRLVATNTMSTGAYRGFGQTQAAMIRERAVDLVARALGRHPAELREQNMIEPHELPYQIRTQIVFDNGDYRHAVRRARELIEDDPPAPDDGRARGVGYCSYVQLAGIGPSFMNEIIGLKIGGFESAVVKMEPDGTVRVHTGISPHGQGQETTFAQLVADQLGVGIDDVDLVHGDTDQAPYSAYGTAASRSMAVGGGAAYVAAQKVAEKIRHIAAEMLEANPDDIELAGGLATVAGTPVSVPIRDVAHKAWTAFGLPAGMEPGLQATYCYDPVSGTFSYATHACRVAVDRDTGLVEVEDYVVVNDCGTIVNPTIVEGQIHGGIAQGLGAAILEEVVYDGNGQPLTSTLLDYLPPVSDSIPDIRIEHMEIPSPYTPGGMKGVGEGGTNGAFACIVNAIANALPELSTEEIATPLTPSRIWSALHPSP